MTQRKPGPERNFINGFLVGLALLLVGFGIYWLAF